MQEDRPIEERTRFRPGSVLGGIACVFATPMIVLELALSAAVLSGLKDSQGFLYASFPTLGVLFLGLPFCLAFAIEARVRGGRDSRPARLAMALCLGIVAAASTVFLAIFLAGRLYPG
jgi:hypothetical protein